MITDLNIPVSLRALEPSDLDKLYLWENDPEMWQFGCSQAPLSRHQLWEYIQNYDANPIASGQLRLMIDIPGSTVGVLDIYEIDILNRRAYIGIMIASSERRKGYAIAALTAATDYCRDRLGLHQLAAIVAADNNPSKSLFIAAGYRQTAILPDWIRKNQSYIDARLFQLRLTQ